MLLLKLTAGRRAWKREMSGSDVGLCVWYDTESIILFAWPQVAYRGQKRHFRLAADLWIIELVLTGISVTIIIKSIFSDLFTIWAPAPTP